MELCGFMRRHENTDTNCVGPTYRFPKTTLEKSVMKSSGILIDRNTKTTNSALGAGVVFCISISDNESKH